eukprot:2685388-Ditylum_brightwellii.AAC.1
MIFINKEFVASRFEQYYPSSLLPQGNNHPFVVKQLSFVLHNAIQPPSWLPLQTMSHLENCLLQSTSCAQRDQPSACKNWGEMQERVVMAQ